MKWAGAAALVGLVAIAAIVGLGRSPSKSTSKAAPNASTPAEPTASGRPGAPPSTGGPQSKATHPLPLPASQPGVEAATAATPAVYDSEDRDERWADDQEVRLRAAVLTLEIPGAAIGVVECRRTICRVPVSGVSAAVVELVELLSEERAVIAGSDSIALSRLPAAKDELNAAVFLRYLR